MQWIKEPVPFTGYYEQMLALDKREAALVCRFPRANVSRFCSYYDRRLGNDVRLTDDLRRLVAAKAQVTRARRKLEEYVAWNRANNLFFDEATDEELAGSGRSWPEGRRSRGRRGTDETKNLEPEKRKK